MSKKGLLIVPVEIVKGPAAAGGGCGEMLGAALSFVVIVGVFIFLVANHFRVKDEQARNVSPPVAQPITIDSAPRSLLDESHSLAITESSPQLRTLVTIPKVSGALTASVIWNWDEELGLIGASVAYPSASRDRHSLVVVVNQSGVIASQESTQPIRINSLRSDRVLLVGSPAEILYSNTHHLLPAGNRPSNQSFEFRLNRGYLIREGNLTYDTFQFWSDGENYNNLCEVESTRVVNTMYEPNGFSIINFRINETGYHAAYDTVLLRLWDNNCREVFRYQTSTIIGRMGSLVVTNEGGVLFVEERDNEYLIRYIKF